MSKVKKESLSTAYLSTEQNNSDSDLNINIEEEEKVKDKKIRKDAFGNLINKRKKHKISFSDKLRMTIEISEEIEINRKLSVIEDKEIYDKKKLPVDPFEKQGTIAGDYFLRKDLLDEYKYIEENIQPKTIIEDKVNVPCGVCTIF